MFALTKVRVFLGLLGALGIIGAAIAPAHAQAQRTWVSGVSGSDANACTISMPCKTFAGALLNTAPGGEIDALDPGGYGAVTITKAITIDGGGGQVASVQVSGTNGIVISANQSSDVVILRNLRLNGLGTGASSPAGIKVLSAARVSIENVDVFGFGTTGSTGGIIIAPSSGTMNVNIQNTSTYDNHVGIFVGPTGGAVANVTIENSHADNNLGGGIRVDSTGGSGTSNVAVTDSSMSLNNGNGLNAVSEFGAMNVDLMRDVMANNAQSGVEANAMNGGSSKVTVGNSILSNNVISAWNNPSNDAMLLSYGNNQVTGPAGSTPGPATFQ